MIKAIIFDFFDVIRDDGLTRWLKKHNLTKTGEVLKITDANDRGTLTKEDTFVRFAHLTGETAAEVEDEMENNNDLNESLVEYIHTELKSSYKIGLISNSASKYIRDEISKYQVKSLFDEITISSEVGAIKPEPEIFQMTLERLGCKPEESVFIDDNPSYVDAAQKLGIQGIVYRDFESFRADLEAILKKGESNAQR